MIIFLVAAERNSSKMLRMYAEKNVESKEILLQKAVEQDKKHLKIVSEEEYVKLLESVDAVLTEVEEELASHSGGKLHKLKIYIFLLYPRVHYMWTNKY